MLRFADPSQIDDLGALAAVTGPIRAVERSRLATIGFTGASHERLDLLLLSGERRSLVVKRVRLSGDWTALRSSDRHGREASLLAERTLDPIWEVFACPYLAFAAVGDEIALVMEDLSPHLFPDVREPLGEGQEERLLQALAALHARFWSAPEVGLPWLAQPVHFAGLLDAGCAADPAATAVLPGPLREGITRGWAAALARVPASVAEILSTPAAELSALWEGLPRTLLHGDAKVANFALLPRAQVAAFDWALLGAGAATFDVGWYLAVNASRLSRPKEVVLERYRTLVTAKLGAAVPDPVWASLVRAGLVVAARLLLWSKALAVEADRPGARAEWAWWVDRLAVL